MLKPYNITKETKENSLFKYPRYSRSQGPVHQASPMGRLTLNDLYDKNVLLFVFLHDDCMLALHNMFTHLKMARLHCNYTCTLALYGVVDYPVSGNLKNQSDA